MVELNYNDIWKAALGEIKLDISKANYLTWFKNTFIKDIKNNTVILGVPSSFAKEWLESKYHKLILQSLKNIKPNIRKVEYEVSHECNTFLEPPSAPLKEKVNTKTPEEQLNFTEFTLDPYSNLNPNINYFFSQFNIRLFPLFIHTLSTFRLRN